MPNKAPPPHCLHIPQWQAPTRLFIFAVHIVTALHRQLPLTAVKLDIFFFPVLGIKTLIVPKFDL